MKLISFIHKNSPGIGSVEENEVIDFRTDSTLPYDMISFLAQGEKALNSAALHLKNPLNRIPIEQIELLAPIPRPGKFLGISLNYADHIQETGLEKPEYPTFFTKQGSCVNAHQQPIIRPRVSEKVDYEGELAIVIGKRCKHISESQAESVIAGYTIVNDVSVRDWQVRSPTWTLGKSFDTHGPMGPWLITRDEISDPHNLTIKTWVDDELRQNSNTRFMIYNCFEIIAYLSQAMTLEPGDVIATGTPSGVGVKMKPRGYLKPGQTVKIEIEKLGTLSNPVIEEN